MAYMTRQEVMLLVVCGQLTQYWSTVQYATDLRLRGDVLAKSRVRCHLKKTVKCWAANWIREPNQRGVVRLALLYSLNKKYKTFSRAAFYRPIYKPRYAKGNIITRG